LEFILSSNIEQVETQLKSKNSAARRQPGGPLPQGRTSTEHALSGSAGSQDMLSGFASATAMGQQMPSLTITPSENNPGGDADFPWEMIGLGLEEVPPPADMVQEL
jgi:hypothetical protein